MKIKSVTQLLLSLVTVVFSVFLVVLKAVILGALGGSTTKSHKGSYYDNFTGETSAYGDDSGRYSKL